MTQDSLSAHAQTIIDTNRYLILATADPDGAPWASPVYFAADGLREFYWLSAMDARHTRNLIEQPRVSLVVFDSTVRPYHGRAVYASGAAREVPDADLDRALEIYPGSSDGSIRQFTREEVADPEPYRLYRATASDLWVLCPREPRQPCPLHGLATDHRARVEL